MRNKLAPIDKGLEKLAFRDIPKFLVGKPSTYRNIPRPTPATVFEVRTARRLIRATQQHFARIMGVSIETVKAWEGGSVSRRARPAR